LFVRILNEGSAGSVVVSPPMFLRILKEGAFLDSPLKACEGALAGEEGRQAAKVGATVHRASTGTVQRR
jgi:hypothetical protein